MSLRPLFVLLFGFDICFARGYNKSTYVWTEKIMFYIGCHLSVSGGYEAMGKTALSIGANTFQYFTRNPRGRGFRRPAKADVAALISLMQENGFGPILAHAPYTLNPSSGDERIRNNSYEMMGEDLALLESIPGALYNFHPGCHVGQGEETGISNTAKLLNSIITPGQSTTVLIETMAGKGSEIGANFEQIARLIDLTDADKRQHVGVCLDTCHVWDGGYNIAQDTEAVLDAFDRTIGLDRLRAIHLNDSKNVLGAKKDRHEKIGEGNIGIEGFKSIINNKRIAHLPFYLETPNELDGYAREIELLRGIRDDN